MWIEELKKGLWGYQKASVFQYIAEQEETFSQKLLEQRTQAEQLSRQYQTRIEALEDALRQAQDELWALRAKQYQIPNALLEAQTCADRMKMETQAREQAAQAAVEKALSAELSELERYQDRIAALRQHIQQTLRTFEQTAEQLEQQARELTAGAPCENLTLFQRKPAQGDVV